MTRRVWRGWPALTLPCILAAAAETPPIPLPAPAAESSPLASPPPAPGDRPFPINLPTALKLADADALDIALASQRIQVAAAQLQRANVLWLPTLDLGGDYFRHEGPTQNADGSLTDASRGQLLVGAGPSMVFALSDALFAPLAAPQELRAREAALQAATNDTLLAVAEAYFNVQQARGELAGALDSTRRATELVRRAEGLAEGLAAPVEATRARVELSRRRQAEHAARERWRISSAELARLLRLDPAALVEPLEPPNLRVSLVAPEQSVDELIPLGLSNRPELAAQQALVQATLERLRQEKLRPLIPSVLLRGATTPVTGTLGAGYFGGGANDNLSNFNGRMDLDLQVLWELRNLGLGNRALVRERSAEHELSLLELFRVQDRVAAEVAQAHAQSRSAADRLSEAEAELRDAVESVEKNFEGLQQTRRAGGLVLLVVRPQEVVAAVQALAQAYNDYYGAVADFNRAQFRLYRAMGQPARLLLDCEKSLSREPWTSAVPPE